MSYSYQSGAKKEKKRRKKKQFLTNYTKQLFAVPKAKVQKNLVGGTKF